MTFDCELWTLTRTRGTQLAAQGDALFDHNRERGDGGGIHGWLDLRNRPSGNQAVLVVLQDVVVRTKDPTIDKLVPTQLQIS